MEKNLAENIQDAIKSAGGRIALATAIIKECPEWFTSLEAKYFTDRDKWNRNRYEKMDHHVRETIWSEEDVQYVLDNFGKMKTSKLAKILRRSSSAAVSQKFHSMATEDQKIKAASYKHGWRKSTSFSYGN